MTRVLPASRVAALVGDFDRDPAYEGLAEALRVLVTDGRIPSGVRLPSERELTGVLGVSRTTVTRAYAVLREHGYLASRQGSGSVATLPDGPGLRADHLLTPENRDDDTIDLTCAAPSPAPGMLAVYQRALADLPGYLAGTGYHPSGLPVLREAVARSYADRGLPTDPAQVLVVPGALSGVAVITHALLRRGDRVVVESPTYPNAIAALKHAGARIVGVDLDPHRAEARDLADEIGRGRPRLAYLIPDFHNPTGHLLGDRGRALVGRALERAGTIAVVDESMSLLDLEGRAMPAPLAAYSPGAISVGSVSKPFWGGLRVGWLRVPEALVEDVFRARLALDLGVPVLEQLAAATLLGEGTALLAHRREALRASRDAALAALASHLPDWRVTAPGGGLSLWCELPEPLSSALVPRAALRDVLLAPGPSFAPEGGLDRFVRVPFTQPPHVLVDAIGRLAEAWTETLADPVRRSPLRRRDGDPTPHLVA